MSLAELYKSAEDTQFALASECTERLRTSLDNNYRQRTGSDITFVQSVNHLRVSSFDYSDLSDWIAQTVRRFFQTKQTMEYQLTASIREMLGAGETLVDT